MTFLEESEMEDDSLFSRQLEQWTHMLDEAMSDKAVCEGSYAGANKQGYTTPKWTSLDAFPSKPISLKNKRIAVAGYAKEFLEKSPDVQLKVPSSLFAVNNLDGRQVNACFFLKSGLCRLDIWKKMPQEAIDLLAAFREMSEDQQMMCRDLLAGELPESDEEDAVFEMCDKVLKLPEADRALLIATMAGKPEKPASIMFTPTMLDVFRIFKESGQAEIPLALLKKAVDNDDVNQKEFYTAATCPEIVISEAKAAFPFFSSVNPDGKGLYVDVKNSEHVKIGKMFPQYKPSTFKVFSSDFGGDIGDVAYKIVQTRDGVVTPVILTTRGVAVIYNLHGTHVNTAFIANPEEIIWYMTDGDVKFLKPSGSVTSVPVDYLELAIRNMCSHLTDLDTVQMKKNNRRYIEKYD